MSSVKGRTMGIHSLFENDEKRQVNEHAARKAELEKVSGHYVLLQSGGNKPISKTPRESQRVETKQS